MSSFLVIFHLSLLSLSQLAVSRVQVCAARGEDGLQLPLTRAALLGPARAVDTRGRHVPGLCGDISWSDDSLPQI